MMRQIWHVANGVLVPGESPSVRARRRLMCLLPVVVGSASRRQAFSPTDISGLVLWLKADDGPDDPVDGQPVSTWSDKSGQGNDATQTGTARPTYQTNIINGKPAILFDGVDDVLTAGTLSLTDATLWFVAKTASSSAIMVPIQADKYDWASRQGISIVQIADTTVKTITSYPSSDLTLANFERHAATFSVSGGNVTGEVFLNNVSKASATVTQASTHTGVAVGGFDTLVNFYKDYIAEICVYNRVLNSTELTSLDDYAKSKYGL